MYSAERSIPCDAGVDAETTKSTVAPGATAPDHSTSRSASPSSPIEVIPGSSPFKMTFDEVKFAGNPNICRKACTSAHINVRLAHNRDRLSLFHRSQH